MIIFSLCLLLSFLSSDCSLTVSIEERALRVELVKPITKVTPEALAFSEQAMVGLLRPDKRRDGGMGLGGRGPSMRDLHSSSHMTSVSGPLHTRGRRRPA